MYKPNELKQSCDGVYKRFPKLSTYRKSLKDLRTTEKSFGNLRRYANEGNFEFSLVDRIHTYSWYNLILDLKLYAYQIRIQSYRDAIDGVEGWEYDFKRSTLYKYWSARIQFIFHDIAYEKFKNGTRTQQLKSLYLREIGVTLGECASLGWFQKSNDLLERTDSHLRRKNFLDAYDRSFRRRTQHLILKLLSDFSGKKEVQKDMEIKCAYDVDLLNKVVANWDTNDFNLLKSILSELADRHTHQCRQDSWNNDRFYDFENFDLEYYLPFEILCIEKLRKSKGLETPKFEHKLFDAPFGKLIENNDVPECSFLDSLLQRAGEENPNILI